MMVTMLAALIALATGTVQQAPANKGSDATFYRSEKRFGIATPEKGRNTCSWAFDGSCDDGGTGSEYSMCAPGTDKADCGDNSCSAARDGDCDDGGWGAEYSVCSIGSDCADCGSRSLSYPR